MLNTDRISFLYAVTHSLFKQELGPGCTWMQMCVHVVGFPNWKFVSKWQVKLLIIVYNIVTSQLCQHASRNYVPREISRHNSDGLKNLVLQWHLSIKTHISSKNRKTIHFSKHTNTYLMLYLILTHHIKLVLKVYKVQKSLTSFQTALRRQLSWELSFWKWLFVGQMCVYCNIINVLW